MLRRDASTYSARGTTTFMWGEPITSEIGCGSIRSLLLSTIRQCLLFDSHDTRPDEPKWPTRQEAVELPCLLSQNLQGRLQMRSFVFDKWPYDSSKKTAL